MVAVDGSGTGCEDGSSGGAHKRQWWQGTQAAVVAGHTSGSGVRREDGSGTGHEDDADTHNECLTLSGWWPGMRHWACGNEGCMARKEGLAMAEAKARDLGQATCATAHNARHGRRGAGDAVP